MQRVLSRRPSMGAALPPCISSATVTTVPAPPAAHLKNTLRRISSGNGSNSSSSALDLFAGKGPIQANTLTPPPDANSDFFSMLSFPMPTFSWPGSSSDNDAKSSGTTPFSWLGVGPWQDEEGATASEQGMLDDDDKGAKDEPPWARVKDHYEKPKLPVVFLHGLFGFNTFGPPGMLQISYWRGVREAFEAAKIEALFTAVPASASIEERAEALHELLKQKMAGREINLVGHSQGGLDARYLCASIRPTEYTVRSVTSIASPHRGSSVADTLVDSWIGEERLPTFLSLLSAIPGGGKAFSELRTSSMAKFNEANPDQPGIQYFSYGARCYPGLLDKFRIPWSIMKAKEGDNDGLVSVESSKWGEVRCWTTAPRDAMNQTGQYVGTLENVDHLDLIGWVSRMRYAFAELSGNPIKFKPVSFYMSVAEHLAQKGL